MSYTTFIVIDSIIDPDESVILRNAWLLNKNIYIFTDSISMDSSSLPFNIIKSVSYKHKSIGFLNDPNLPVLITNNPCSKEIMAITTFHPTLWKTQNDSDYYIEVNNMGFILSQNSSNNSNIFLIGSTNICDPLLLNLGDNTTLFECLYNGLKDYKDLCVIDEVGKYRNFKLPSTLLNFSKSKNTKSSKETSTVLQSSQNIKSNQMPISDNYIENSMKKRKKIKQEEKKITNVSENEVEPINTIQNNIVESTTNNNINDLKIHSNNYIPGRKDDQSLLVMNQYFEPMLGRYKRSTVYNSLNNEYQFQTVDKERSYNPKYAYINASFTEIFHFKARLQLKDNQRYYIPTPSADAKIVKFSTNSKSRISLHTTLLFQYYIISPKSEEIEITAEFRATPNYFMEIKDVKFVEDIIPQKCDTIPESLIEESKDFYQSILIKSNSKKEFIINLTDKIRRFSGIYNPDLSRSYLADICTQNAGACRHRTLLFYCLANYHGVPTHYITNDIHSFVEIWIGNKWVGIDLGGKQSNVKKNLLTGTSSKTYLPGFAYINELGNQPRDTNSRNSYKTQSEKGGVSIIQNSDNGNFKPVTENKQNNKKILVNTRNMNRTPRTREYALIGKILVNGETGISKKEIILDYFNSINNQDNIEDLGSIDDSYSLINIKNNYIKLIPIITINNIAEIAHGRLAIMIYIFSIFILIFSIYPQKIKFYAEQIFKYNN